MAFCEYKAVDLDGKDLRGKCWCTSKEDLAKAFRNKGYYLVRYKELNNSSWRVRKNSLSLSDLSVFCHQFASLLSVGINIFEAIVIIIQETTNKPLKKSLEDIEHMVRQGVQLSTCMSTYKGAFPKFMIDMINIGEESGTLDMVLQRLSEYYNRENKVKNKMAKAMSYPVILFIVSNIVVQILLIYVIPIFISTLEELGGSVPQMTRMVLSVSYFFRENFDSIMLVVLFGVSIAVYIRKLDNAAIFFQKLIMENTFTKIIARKIIAVKISRALGILLNSGIPVIKALEITKNTAGNDFIKEKLENCIDSIKKGNTFSQSLSELNIFPGMLCSMARIGEESGALSEMMVKASVILEEELHNTIEKVASLMEPMLIIFISIFVGFILITLVGPMFQIMEAI
jgi:type IV pilus assembly protein PilC